MSRFFDSTPWKCLETHRAQCSMHPIASEMMYAVRLLQRNLNQALLEIHLQCLIILAMLTHDYLNQPSTVVAFLLKRLRSLRMRLDESPSRSTTRTFFEDQFRWSWDSSNHAREREASWTQLIKHQCRLDLEKTLITFREVRRWILKIYSIKIFWRQIFARSRIHIQNLQAMRSERLG